METERSFEWVIILIDYICLLVILVVCRDGVEPKCAPKVGANTPYTNFAINPEYQVISDMASELFRDF